MVGVPFNPDNCAFIANQALNTNQFNGGVLNASNITTHTVLWDFVEQKLYWVNTKTNIIEHEIPGDASCDFVADITYVGTIEGAYTYSCIPTNGVAPFTYQWSLRAAPANNDFTVIGSTTNQNIVLGLGGFIGQSGFSTLLQCRVTDSEGCKTTAYFGAFVQIEVPPIP